MVSSGRWFLDRHDLCHLQTMILMISWEFFVLSLFAFLGNHGSHVLRWWSHKIETGRIHNLLLESELPWRVPRLAESLWEWVINFYVKSSWDSWGCLLLPDSYWVGCESWAIYNNLFNVFLSSTIGSKMLVLFYCYNYHHCTQSRLNACLRTGRTWIHPVLHNTWGFKIDMAHYRH